MNGRGRFPFTASQWQELEHQALIFKYMALGMPIPPDLLLSIKRSYLDSPLTSRLFSRQSQQIGWNCFQMGLGRKVDPEPGRCRRTDGKKWRCSKEAYPDSKYCERHMHRGKNRSRKPVEAVTVTAANSSSTPIISPITKDSPSSFSSTSFFSPETQHNHHHHHQQSQPHYSPYHTTPSHSFLHPHISSRTTLSSQEHNTHSLMESGSYSQMNTDYRRNGYVYGLKEEVDEHPFFQEPSGTIRSFSGSSSVDDSWQLTPLTMSSSSCSKQKSCLNTQSEYSYLQLQSIPDHIPKQHKQDQHSYLLGNEIKFGAEKEEPPKTVHMFFDEWPPKQRETWLDLDNNSSSSTSVSTTRLSISMPSSSHDLPIFTSRNHNDG